MRFALMACVAALVGCATEGEQAHHPKAPQPARSTPSAPPNMVMLDYRDAPAQSAAAELPPPEDPPRPPMRRTITIGKNNPDRAYENEAGPNAGAAPYEAPPPRSTTTYAQYYYGGYAGYAPAGAGYSRGGGTGGGTGGGIAPGPAAGPGSITTPGVGGNWPTAPSYGPAPVRSRTQP